MANIVLTLGAIVVLAWLFQRSGSRTERHKQRAKAAENTLKVKEQADAIRANNAGLTTDERIIRMQERAARYR